MNGVVVARARHECQHGHVHEINLITTIAFGLTAALIFGLLAKRFGLSPIVGYLIAGFVIGPHTPGFVGDVGLAKQLGIERGEAQAYVDRYFERYPGVRRYMDETRASARRLGFVSTVVTDKRAGDTSDMDYTVTVADMEPLPHEMFRIGGLTGFVTVAMLILYAPPLPLLYYAPADVPRVENADLRLLQIHFVDHVPAKQVLAHDAHAIAPEVQQPDMGSAQQHTADVAQHRRLLGVLLHDESVDDRIQYFSRRVPYDEPLSGIQWSGAPGHPGENEPVVPP